MGARRMLGTSQLARSETLVRFSREWTSCSTGTEVIISWCGSEITSLEKRSDRLPVLSPMTHPAPCTALVSPTPGGFRELQGRNLLLFICLPFCRHLSCSHLYSTKSVTTLQNTFNVPDVTVSPLYSCLPPVLFVFMGLCLLFLRCNFGQRQEGKDGAQIEYACF